MEDRNRLVAVAVLAAGGISGPVIIFSCAFVLAAFVGPTIIGVLVGPLLIALSLVFARHSRYRREWTDGIVISGIVVFLPTLMLTAISLSVSEF